MTASGLIHNTTPVNIVLNEGASLFDTTIVNNRQKWDLTVKKVDKYDHTKVLS